MSPEGRKQTDAQVSFYLENARIINEGLKSLGLPLMAAATPLCLVKNSGGISSWDFFDKLLNECHVVGTPGSGFGPAGEGFQTKCLWSQENI